jgi:hypothetical protein
MDVEPSRTLTFELNNPEFGARIVGFLKLGLGGELQLNKLHFLLWRQVREGQFVRPSAPVKLQKKRLVALQNRPENQRVSN